MDDGFRPLLAASIDDDEQLSQLKYPLIGSPKVDGIRVVCHPTRGPVTRSLKPVRNHHVRSILSDPLLEGFDGEVTVGPPTASNVFNATTCIMAADGTPDFTYHIFDQLQGGRYTDRHAEMRMRYCILPTRLLRYVAELRHKVLLNPLELLAYEQDCLIEGFEGIMLRSPSGKYKFNRSTLKEQILLKLKRFQDSEAVIEGFEELYRNNNPQVRDNLGLAERSSHQANMIPAGMLGNLQVKDLKTGQHFSIGSGFDMALRQEIWNNRPQYLGKIVTYKSQPTGVLEAPRFPIFVRFRDKEDMSK